MTKLVCDGCGEEGSAERDSGFITIRTIDRGTDARNRLKTKDLCPDCSMWIMSVIENIGGNR